MIIITDNTVFNTNAEYIVNTVNCVGVMGKGLALEFSLRYPDLNKIYIEQCKRNEIKTGQIYDYNINGTKIINFPTKNDYKYPSKYKWIEEGLIDFVKKYKDLNIKSIAFPLLGCTNGELDKNIILSIMKKHLDLPDIKVYICKSSLLAGKEQKMLNQFKSCSIEELTKIAKLNKNQISVIQKNQLKIHRFYQILDLPKIGKLTYKKLFVYFYHYEENTHEQLSLFD